jgi:hypothetical protein
MNNKFVIAALFGVLTFDQVMASRLENEYDLLELEDDNDYAGEDLQELDADVSTFAPAAPAKPAAKAAVAKAADPKKKEDSSTDESTSDDERHEAYKVGDRNTAQN